MMRYDIISFRVAVTISLSYPKFKMSCALSWSNNFWGKTVKEMVEVKTQMVTMVEVKNQMVTMVEVKMQMVTTNIMQLGKEET